MKKYEEALEQVYSQVAPEVNELYEHYREKLNLEEETNTERQLEILTMQKKIISKIYIKNLSLIANYYAREMTSMYESSLQNYKECIKGLLKG